MSDSRRLDRVGVLDDRAALLPGLGEHPVTFAVDQPGQLRLGHGQPEQQVSPLDVLHHVHHLEHDAGDPPEPMRLLHPDA